MDQNKQWHELKKQISELANEIEKIKLGLYNHKTILDSILRASESHTTRDGEQNLIFRVEAIERQVSKLKKGLGKDSSCG